MKDKKNKKTNKKKLTEKAQTKRKKLIMVEREQNTENKRIYRD